MAAQLSLFPNFVEQNLLLQDSPRKRVRYKIPTYKKVYSVYQYDREKYSAIWNKLHRLALRLNNAKIFFGVNPYSVLRHCYIKEDGRFVHLGDEPHIFRIKSLHDIQSEIYNYSSKPLCRMSNSEELSWQQCGILFFYDCQNGGIAEIAGSQSDNLKTRLKKHIKLLRNLRKGYGLQKAVRFI